MQVALERLHKQAINNGHAGFYGSVTGTHFILYQNIGPDQYNSDDDPQLSGYIQPEGSGCRVFARIRVPDRTGLRVHGGLWLLLLCLGFFILLDINPTSISFSGTLGFLHKSKFYIPIIGFFIALYWWWNYIKVEKPAAIQQFKRLLEAESQQ